MENKKALNLLGMAYIAKKMIVGEEKVYFALKKGIVKIVLVANDASSKTIDNFSKKCFFYKVDLDLSFNTEEMSKSIGKDMAKIIAITDEGFYNSLNKLLKRGVSYES